MPQELRRWRDRPALYDPDPGHRLYEAVEGVHVAVGEALYEFVMLLERLGVCRLDLVAGLTHTVVMVPPQASGSALAW